MLLQRVVIDERVDFRSQDSDCRGKLLSVYQSALMRIQCTEASEVHQLEQLDQLGFEVLPVPFRDAYPFGGGLHCATGDVFREGNCEDYFPVQVPGTQLRTMA